MTKHGVFQRLTIVPLPPTGTDLNCRTPAQRRMLKGGRPWESRYRRSLGLTLSQSRSHSQSECTSLRLRQSVDMHKNECAGVIHTHRHGGACGCCRSLPPFYITARERHDLSGGRTEGRSTTAQRDAESLECEGQDRSGDARVNQACLGQRGQVQH